MISLLFYEIFVAPTSNAKDYPAIMCVLEVGYGRRSISAGLFTKLSAAMTLYTLKFEFVMLSIHYKFDFVMHIVYITNSNL